MNSTSEKSNLSEEMRSEHFKTLSHVMRVAKLAGDCIKSIRAWEGEPFTYLDSPTVREILKDCMEDLAYYASLEKAMYPGKKTIAWILDDLCNEIESFDELDKYVTL